MQVLPLKSTCASTKRSTSRCGKRIWPVSPEDVSTAACLLDFYANRLRFVPDLTSRRVRLIRWVIENHPDISLTGFLERDLRIAAADPSVVTEIRSLWLAQIAHYADNWHVLLNAGNSMGLADPELAAQWLWQGCKLQPDNWEVAGALGYIYANAIAGIVAYGADLQPTAIDRSRSHSEFSQRAWNEASQDAVLATATGRYLHSLTMAHTSMGVVRIDYDPLAEQLFEKAQNLQYPAATPFNELGFLYENQSWKRGDAAVRLTPKSRIIDLTPTEAAQRVVPRPAVPRVVGFACGVKSSLERTDMSGPAWRRTLLQKTRWRRSRRKPLRECSFFGHCGSAMSQFASEQR